MSERLGTPDADTMIGTDLVDQFRGLAGDDVLEGMGGDDVLYGDGGADVLRGDVGNDVLAGGDGEDALAGGAGGDTIQGGAGDDRITGGDGDDVMALTGIAADYAFAEISPASASTLALYSVTDRRPGAPDGSDTFSGIERIRFGSGPEFTLAEVLGRAPSEITLKNVPITGAEVRETAVAGDFVARLTALDPDPGDSVVWTFATAGGVPADGDGRFTIDGDVLRVARGNAFDFEETGSHAITLVATDRSGLSVSKIVNVVVRDDTDAFSALLVQLPDGAQDVRLWDQASGGFVVTWRHFENGSEGWYSRRIDESGATIGDPAPADRLLMKIPSGLNSSGVLGVDDDGIAALVTSRPNETHYDNRVQWIDTADGRSLRSRNFDGFAYSEESYSSTPGNPPSSVSRGSHSYSTYGVYDFDEGYVLVGHSLGSGHGTYGNNGYSYFSYGSSQERQTITAIGARGQSFELAATETSSSHSDRGSFRVAEQNFLYDIAPDGTIAYLRGVSNGYYIENTTVTSSVMVAGRTIISQTEKLSGNYYREIVVDVAVADRDHYAYALMKREFGASEQLSIHFGGAVGAQTDYVLAAGHRLGTSDIIALGSTRYLVTYLDFGGIATQLRAQVFDTAGKALTTLLTFSTDTIFAPRDDGTVVAYRTVTDETGFTTLEAQIALAETVLVTPAAGSFTDSDGNGTPDYRGTIALGYASGVQSILRLEGGAYEQVDNTLRVRNATVYADIGNNRVDALFKGSFDIDRGTGVASNFVVTPNSTALKFSGLVPTITGLTLKADAAAFNASFTMPDGLLDTPLKLETKQGNALLINAYGPAMGGFEFSLPPAQLQQNLSVFGLFEAKAKGLKVRYDAVADEWAFGGELELKSALIDGALSAFGKPSDAALTFKDFKIKNGLYDFEGEFALKRLEGPGGLALTNVKFGIKIDDNVVQSIDVAGGVTLPFAKFTGLSFAGQLLNPPMSVNKFGITAETAIPLSHGFFLDSIAATLDNLAPSPPAPTALPVMLTGALGIGWGLKIPKFTPPAFTGLDEVKDARLVNAKFSVSTTFGQSISAVGTVNLYKDEIFKITGTVTWDWQKNSMLVQGEYDLLSGIAKATGSMRVSPVGFVGQASYALALPNFAGFGPIAGLTLFNANGLTQMVDDDDSANDLIAIWQVSTIPLFGSVTLGVKFNVIDFTFAPILGADDVPKAVTTGFSRAITDDLAWFGHAGTRAPARVAAATVEGFAVAPGKDWVMFSAVWEQPTDAPVRLRVRRPDGSVIEEADFAAHGIVVIDLLSGTIKRTIGVLDPAAGDWAVEVVDTAGLGTVTYSAYSANPAVTVSAMEAALVAGEAAGTATALLTGTDPGTRVTFWADTDAEGLDGFALGGTIVDADGAVSVAFDAALLSGGQYFVYALADDGRGAPASAYSATPIIVAHRPTGILFETASEPTDPDAQGVVLESAAPGTIIGRLTAESPDAAETHVFTLVDDAGGRFALQGNVLVVGSAPFDAGAPASVVVRATSSAGLSYDTPITFEIAADEAGWSVLAGQPGQDDILIGGSGRDVFHAVDDSDIVSGRTGEDILYLDGDLADFAIEVDLTGESVGYIYAQPVPDEADVPPVRSSLDPAPPYLLIRDLRTGGAPLIASGIETLQFRDQRFDATVLTGSAPVRDLYDTLEDERLDVGAAFGVLDNDPVSGLAALVAGPANGTLVLRKDGSFTYTPEADFHGTDRFTYRVGESAPTRVAITVAAANDTPVILRDITGPVANVTVAENTRDVLSAFASDIDGDRLAYSISGGSDARAFHVTARGLLRFAAPPNVEVPGDADGDNRYEVQIMVDDGKAAVHRTIIVTVSDVADHVRFDGTDQPDDARNFTPLDWIATGGDGDDILTGGRGGDAIAGQAGDDLLRGAAGDDLLLGGDGDDMLFGHKDDDQLIGGAANDRLIGGMGDDRLDGGAGRDRLVGGTGDDLLIGGGGRDLLIGAAGADRFRIDTPHPRARDIVRDFTIGEDVIELARDAFALADVAPGALDPQLLAFGPAADGAAQRFVYDRALGVLYFDADGDGAESAITLALFTGAPALTVQDFVLV